MNVKNVPENSLNKKTNEASMKETMSENALLLLLKEFTDKVSDVLTDRRNILNNLQLSLTKEYLNKRPF